MSYITEPPNQLKLIALGAVNQAQIDMGRGESGGNNVGKYVWSLTGYRTSGPWCAAAVYAWFLRSADALELRLPVTRTHSARKLCRRIGAVGRFIPPDQMPQQGDVMLRARGLPRYGKGHTGIVEHVDATTRTIWTIEGNVGKYPAIVRRFPHEPNERKLLGWYRLW